MEKNEFNAALEMFIASAKMSRMDIKQELLDFHNHTLRNDINVRAVMSELGITVEEVQNMSNEELVDYLVELVNRYT